MISQRHSAVLNVLSYPLGAHRVTLSAELKASNLFLQPLSSLLRVLATGSKIMQPGSAEAQLTRFDYF